VLSAIIPAFPLLNELKILSRDWWDDLAGFSDFPPFSLVWPPFVIMAGFEV
jgi:hypothetical protein